MKRNYNRQPNCYSIHSRSVLPKERVETRESIFDTSPKTVYDMVTNNRG